MRESAGRSSVSSSIRNLDMASAQSVLTRTKVHLLLVFIAIITSQFLIWPFVAFLVAIGGYLYPLDLLINSICVYLMLPLEINENCWRLMTCFCCRVWCLMCKRCCRHSCKHCCRKGRKREEKRQRGRSGTGKRPSVELPPSAGGGGKREENEDSDCVHVDAGEGLDLLSGSGKL